MGETSVWGYAALAAVVIGFAYGFWRQNHVSKRKAAAIKRQQELSGKISEAEKEKD